MSGHGAGWVPDTEPSGYHGRHRADEADLPFIWPGGLPYNIWPEPDDPARCWSCGHPLDAGCECSCCPDEADNG